jgi:hypothetical protein
VLTEHGYHSFQLSLVHLLGTAQDNGIGAFYLIVEELTEVLHVNLALGGIYYGNKAVQLYGNLLSDTLYGTDDIRQLAYAGGLDQDAIRVELGQYLLQSSAEIANQRAADTTGIHLGNLNTGIL